MADKEATVYVVDVGASMGKKHSGRQKSDLEWAMEWIWDKVTYTVSTDRKQFAVGVVGLRTDETKNEIAEDEGYRNISVLHELGQLLMPGLRKLSDEIKPSSTANGDAISAVVIAMEMIKKFTRQLKYFRKIFLVTNGDGSIDPDDIPEIAQQLQEHGISLTVLGVDFDDFEFGFKEEGKSRIKAENEKVLASLVEQSGGGGVFGTLRQAIVELGAPRLKVVRPVVSYKGLLTLGNPDSENPESVFSVYVERFSRTMVAKPKTMSSFVTHSDLSTQMGSDASSATIEPDAGHGQDRNYMAAVRNTHVYQVPDEDGTGTKKEVNRDELEKGYEYGREAVAISATDETITKIETSASLEIIGFVPQDKFDRYLPLSESKVIVGSRTDPKAILAMSSFIHALYEMETYAVARLVVKDGKAPIIVILAPSIEPDYECLIELQIPFAEDVRSYRFPPLDRVVTVSGKVVTEHRNLPKDDLMVAMSDYVDQMDLSELATNDEGEPSEYMAMEDTYSPILHRLDQATRWRAVHPIDPFPPPPEFLTRYTQIPSNIVQSTKPYLASLIKASNVRKVPPKVKGRKRNRDVDKPLSGLDVESLLHHEKRVKISPDNAIPEFKQMLEVAVDPDGITDAVNQLSTIIESRITNSMGDTNYDRAAEEIGTMRHELIELEMPDIYNVFMQMLKTRLSGGELGGDRREMWQCIRTHRLGLIDKVTSATSDVDAAEAKEFLRAI